jgi:GDP-4-dehydro-6-deoxy-D-mannose reductase
MLLDFAGARDVEVREEPERLRPSDVPLLIGDNTKFVKKTGWQPTITYEKTLADILAYWRERI